jgi:hypothetical protein
VAANRFSGFAFSETAEAVWETRFWRGTQLKQGANERLLQRHVAAIKSADLSAHSILPLGERSDIFAIVIPSEVEESLSTDYEQNKNQSRTSHRRRERD